MFSIVPERAFRVKLFATALVLAAGCAPSLRGGYVAKDGMRYRVVAPPEASWRPLAFGENDVAFGARQSPHLIAANATCSDHGDPPIDVLAQHLLFGFSERDALVRTPITLDGREAMRVVGPAALDGVAVDLELWVVKKDGCVYDFTYIAPRGQAPAQQAAFDAVVQGFHAEAKP